MEIASTPPTNQPLPRLVTTEHVRQFMDILRSLGTKQEAPPPPAAVAQVDSEQPKARGSTLEFKKVNEVWDKKEYKYKVVESLAPANGVNELDHYVFIARTRLEKETKNQIQYVDIKSAGLRDILREVLQDVQGICLHEEKPSVEQNILYHYLLDLEECCQNPSVVRDRSALEHLDLLIGFIRTAYASIAERLGPLLTKHQITYDLLWTLFKPNTLAHTKCFGTGQPRCVKYEFREEKTANGGIKYFHVKARYFDFDGRVFREMSSEHAIEKFRGAKQITALEVFPLKFHPDEEHLRAHLTTYGRKFISMMGVHLCDYKGKRFYIEKDRVVEIPVESRVVVDAAYFREENPNYARPSIKTSVKSSPAGWHVIGFDNPEEVSASAKDKGMDPSEVRGDDLLICSATVPAFSLGDRKWEVAVANIKEIDWKQAALDDLHIPPRKKKAVQALSEAHVKRAMTHSFDDVVAGKRQGFSVLLQLVSSPCGWHLLTQYISGPPDVGKTLTAELIAEHLRRPLMPVSAGELGTTAETVEMRLPRIFKRASRWKAVLLLDEADVLLEQRSSHDYPSKCSQQIDDAIASRIHFKLKYDKLNLEQRSNVWRYFLGAATTPQGAAIYSLGDFEDWTRKERNGREVDTPFKTSRSKPINRIVSDQKPSVNGSSSGDPGGMPGDDVPSRSGYCCI
ncbi:uncharacterized protein RAG0_03160 [Rhynchosporium agropyri]|uniref:Uncharacterized protein n=1 Tax=Rhynchosporium agropyri TaxID=914238 RepID=A0A1E1K3U8_9HELO|nr:uncharacterized protein RAG0_03160 [Rhynchosporium agropyri]